MRDDIKQYLEGWYNKKKITAEADGFAFNLSFDEFVAAWGPKRIAKLEALNDAGQLYSRMSRHNDLAWVVGWRDRAARDSGIIDASTVDITTRRAQLQRFLNQKGAVLSAKTRERIAKARTGTKHSAATKAAMSASQKGLKDNDATKAAKSAAAKARWAAYRERKAGEACQ